MVSKLGVNHGVTSLPYVERGEFYINHQKWHVSRYVDYEGGSFHFYLQDSHGVSYTVTKFVIENIDSKFKEKILSLSIQEQSLFICEYLQKRLERATPYQIHIEQYNGEKILRLGEYGLKGGISIFGLELDREAAMLSSIIYIGVGIYLYDTNSNRNSIGNFASAMLVNAGISGGLYAYQKNRTEYRKEEYPKQLKNGAIKGLVFYGSGSCIDAAATALKSFPILHTTMLKISSLMPKTFYERIFQGIATTSEVALSMMTLKMMGKLPISQNMTSVLTESGGAGAASMIAGKAFGTRVTGLVAVRMANAAKKASSATKNKWEEMGQREAAMASSIFHIGVGVSLYGNGQLGNFFSRVLMRSGLSGLTYAYQRDEVDYRREEYRAQIHSAFPTELVFSGSSWLMGSVGTLLKNCQVLPVGLLNVASYVPDMIWMIGSQGVLAVIENMVSTTIFTLIRNRGKLDSQDRGAIIKRAGANGIIKVTGETSRVVMRVLLNKVSEILDLSITYHYSFSNPVKSALLGCLGMPLVLIGMPLEGAVNAASCKMVANICERYLEGKAIRREDIIEGMKLSAFMGARKDSIIEFAMLFKFMIVSIRLLQSMNLATVEERNIAIFLLMPLLLRDDKPAVVRAHQLKRENLLERSAQIDKLLVPFSDDEEIPWEIEEQFEKLKMENEEWVREEEMIRDIYNKIRKSETLNNVAKTRRIVDELEDAMDWYQRIDSSLLRENFKSLPSLEEILIWLESPPAPPRDVAEIFSHTVLVHAVTGNTPADHYPERFGMYNMDRAAEDKAYEARCCIQTVITEKGEIGSHLRWKKGGSVHFAWNQLVQPHKANPHEGEYISQAWERFLQSHPLENRDNAWKQFAREWNVLNNWEDATVAFLEPYQVFERSINHRPFSVAAFDTFIIKPHVFSREATILVPHSLVEGGEREFVAAHLRAFEGRIATFNPDHESLRAAINRTLQERYPGTWRICDREGRGLDDHPHPTRDGYEMITYLKKPEGGIYPLMNRDGSGDQPFGAVSWFKSSGRHVGLHTGSVTAQLEDHPYFRLLERVVERRSVDLNPNEERPFLFAGDVVGSFERLGSLEALRFIQGVVNRQFDGRTGVLEVAKYIMIKAIYADLMSVFCQRNGRRCDLSEFELSMIVLPYYEDFSNLLEDMESNRSVAEGSPFARYHALLAQNLEGIELAKGEAKWLTRGTETPSRKAAFYLSVANAEWERVQEGALFNLEGNPPLRDYCDKIFPILPVSKKGLQKLYNELSSLQLEEGVSDRGVVLQKMIRLSLQKKIYLDSIESERFAPGFSGGKPWRIIKKQLLRLTS